MCTTNALQVAATGLELVAEDTGLVVFLAVGLVAGVYLRGLWHRLRSKTDYSGEIEISFGRFSITFGDDDDPNEPD